MKSGIREVESLEDFKKVYQVFTGEPYNESFTEEELEEIYMQYRKEGYIFGAYNEKECIGLVAIERGVKKSQPVQFEDAQIMYLADIAVLNDYRNSGLGTQLMIKALMESKRLGYDRIYMRTLEEGKSMSYGIARKVGFQVMPNVIQNVERNRQDGTRTLEKSIFLDFDLNTLDKSILGKTGLGNSVQNREEREK